MTQATNTTQNKEELSKEQQMELFTKFETILRNYKDENAINAYQANFRLMDIFSKSISQAHQSGIEEERKRIKTNIGFLRQWINEKPDNLLVTNEDIEEWLFNFKFLKENNEKASK